MFVKIRVSGVKFRFLKYELLMLFCCFWNPLNQNKQTNKQKITKYYLLSILESRQPCKAPRSLWSLRQMLQGIPTLKYSFGKNLTRHKFCYHSCCLCPLENSFCNIDLNNSKKLLKNKIALTGNPAWHSAMTQRGRMWWKEPQEVEDKPPSTPIPPI